MIIDVMMYKHSLTKSFLYPLIFPWRIEKCLPDWWYWWHYDNDISLRCQDNAKRFGKLRAILAVSNLPRASQVLKTKSVAVRQARRRRPYAAAITGADTPKFRKQSKLVLQRGKIKAQLPCLKVTNLQFQIIRIKILMLKWMIDGRVFKRGHIFTK